ncbi:MAG TPA: DUF5335 family protein [Polyangia bacterium]|nr:DUF5335 family protein [Polyangia bacterium]
MTRIVEIPQVKWRSFLAMLNRLAGGRAVRVEVAQRAIGVQEMGDRLPLREIELETKGSERGHLTITVGSERGALTHLIEQPTHISLGLNEAGEPEWLAVAERGEATTILHFERLPALEAEVPLGP